MKVVFLDLFSPSTICTTTKHLLLYFCSSIFFRIVFLTFIITSKSCALQLTIKWLIVHTCSISLNVHARGVVRTLQISKMESFATVVDSKAVNYCCNSLHLRCLWGSWLRPWMENTSRKLHNFICRWYIDSEIFPAIYFIFLYTLYSSFSFIILNQIRFL